MLKMPEAQAVLDPRPGAVVILAVRATDQRNIETNQFIPGT